MIPNIQINGQTLEEITQAELSKIDNALTAVTQKNATPCILAAENFLNGIKQEYQDLIAANILASHQYKIKKRIQDPDENSDKIALSNQYERNKNSLKDMYARSQVVQLNLKMENFSKELNSSKLQSTKPSSSLVGQSINLTNSSSIVNAGLASAYS